MKSILIVRKADQICKRHTRDLVKFLSNYKVYTEDDVGIPYKQQDIDLMVTIGGDGTILYAARLFQQCMTPPLLTFGRGTLGFMCVYNIEQHQQTIASVLNQEFKLEHKQRLLAKLNDNHLYTALNDVFITKGQSKHVLALDIYINDTFVTQVKGDGLIISTPTGSTAYSLSAGGPLVHNSVNSVQIVPICPLSLSFRPLVLPHDVKITIQLNKESRGEGQIMCDGQDQHVFLRQDWLTIEPSAHDLRLVVPAWEVEDWVIKLQKMLNWNSRFSPREQ